MERPVSGPTPMRWKPVRRAPAARLIAAIGTRTDDEVQVAPSKGPGSATKTGTGDRTGDDHGERAVGQATRPHRRVLAGGQLSLGRPDLPLRQPIAQDAAEQ